MKPLLRETTEKTFNTNPITGTQFKCHEKKFSKMKIITTFQYKHLFNIEDSDNIPSLKQ